LATTAFVDPYNPAERAAGSGLIGAGTGAVIGAIAVGGRGMRPGAAAHRDSDPLAQQEGSAMEDRMRSASPRELPAKPRPLHRRFQRSNVSRSQFLRRGAQTQLH